MTTTLRSYAAFIFNKGGRQYAIGRLKGNSQERTAVGSFVAEGPLTVPAGEEATLYDWHWALRLELAAFSIIGDGTLEIGELYDAPTSLGDGVDYTPAGTRQRWQFDQWVCKSGIWAKSSDLKMAHATLASEVEDDGSHSPKLWGTYLGAATTSKLAYIKLRNPSETEDVEIERLVLGYT